MTIQRWDVNNRGQLEAADDGEVVCFSDTQQALSALEGQRDEFKRQRDILLELPKHQALTGAQARIAELTTLLGRRLEAMKLMSVRLEILTGRMRACHEETGRHELMAEAEAFVSEAKESLADAAKLQQETK